MGKSTLTAQLATRLSLPPSPIPNFSSVPASSNYNHIEDPKLPLNVGILDVDICGPSQPQIFGMQDSKMHRSAYGMMPAICGSEGNISMASIQFLLDDFNDGENPQAVIWRGNTKTTLITQFLRDLQWDDLDIMLIDTPPGTSDEHLALATLLCPKPLKNNFNDEKLANAAKGTGETSIKHQNCLESTVGAILVTTPQEVSWQDVRRQIDFCQKAGIKVLGIVENMAGFRCPSCRHDSKPIGGAGGGMRQYAHDNGIPILATIPMDVSIAIACDTGNIVDAFVGSKNEDDPYSQLVSFIRDLIPC